jgi:two-component system phosphate regulon sensor histidine kinase PhoR
MLYRHLHEPRRRRRRAGRSAPGGCQCLRSTAIRKQLKKIFYLRHHTNLLTLSAIWADDLICERIPLRELFESLYEDAVIIAMKKKIRIELSNREEIVVNGDNLRLRQLFLNLIDNAIKYTPEGGSVDISVQRRDGMADIKFRDSGIGIPLTEQSKIFDRFYRVDKARSREVGGSGLGLAIAKLITELHKGKISVSSEPDHGSTFLISLPITE